MGQRSKFRHQTSTREGVAKAVGEWSMSWGRGQNLEGRPQGREGVAMAMGVWPRPKRIAKAVGAWPRP